MMNIDQLDKAILNIVQRNNLISHAKIGETIGLSTSSVRRRLQALRANKVIASDVSILSYANTGVTLFVSISFAKESVEIYKSFEKQMNDTPEVMQCYHVAGNEDFMLVVHGPSLDWYESWGQATFMANEKHSPLRYNNRLFLQKV